MITKPSDNYKFSVTFQGEQGAGGNLSGYTLSRSMLRIKREDTSILSLVQIDYSTGESIVYYTDPQGVLELPLRDFIVRGAPLLAIAVEMKETDGTSVDTFAAKIDVYEGMSYYDVLAPRNKNADQFAASFLHYVVLPPNVIFNPANGQGIKVESNMHNVNLSLVWAQYAGGVGTTITPAGARSNRLDVNAAADTLKCDDGVSTKSYKLEKIDGCTDVVVCRWTSRTGCVRQHYFPIVSFINRVDDAVSIVSAGNGYDVRKDTADAVRCRLTGLTSYGVWYYMDIFRANDLHAIIQPTFSVFETEISSMETAAYCDINEMETPQENGFHDFEFTLRMKHYDTH